MSIGGHKIRNKNEVHFITFAVVEWVDIFTRKQYKDILIDSLKYCQKEKGLIIYAWCIMSNHVHLAVAAKNQDLSDILCSFTSVLPPKSLRADVSLQGLCVGWTRRDIRSY